MQWHAERQKPEEDPEMGYMLTHPSDAGQWQALDIAFPRFGGDARNIRLGMSTDGLNPFGNQSSTHSTWPVFVWPYNLPPWLCTKQRSRGVTSIGGPRTWPPYGICRDDTTTFGAHRGAFSVFIRTGLTITTGERVASGLIWRFGSLDCISDNAGCFADRPFPANGNIISFGGFDVYVATVAPPCYPRQILRCASPPPGAGASLTAASPCIMHEVMAAGDEQPTKSTRVRGPDLERNVGGHASASGAKPPPPPSRLEEVRAKLSTPLTTGAGADAATVEADLEAHRVLLLKQTEELAAAKRQWEITQREYNRAHGLTPGGDNPSRAGQIRRRGRDLGAEIDRDGADAPAPSMELPLYNTPDKNMLAAEAAAEELHRLEGEELRRQTERVTELLKAANQDANAPRASHARGAAGNARDTAESISPAPSRRNDSRATHASSSRPSRQPAAAAAAGLHQAGTRSKTPSLDASTGRLQKPAALASRHAPGWARASSRQTPEIASTGWSNPASRKKKGQPAQSASGPASPMSP
ncbi:hypothetical protein QYE76_039298 [Lolium multiflorum]|uniref:Uncharacterized protein n=1 Tax=Lolium multiflorum TaxID=4521 RepID=A0AAD8WS12_LOLMU|nr:hypothetical protein QYE76_039298 [Lolium multiflorum]